MKRKNIVILMIFCFSVMLFACGVPETEEKPSMTESMEAENEPQMEIVEKSTEQAENAIEQTDIISEDQAYDAVINYNKKIGSGLGEQINSEGYEEYWNVSTNEDGKIVVLYRSYTAAQTRYYVDPVSGETYVTELVPGIVDEEQKTGETFNVRDYLLTGEEIKETEPTDTSSAPVEYETADGYMGSFLLSSEKDKIDTANDYGELYRVVYNATIEGDELIACGSMDYRNSKDQDPVTISSDVTHIFKTDADTVYLKGTEEGSETVSKEDFAEYLDSRKDSGMFFGVEVKNGIVTTAELYAQ